ncbi:S1C family serine protease [Paenibacillus sp. 481]|uniref:S1C family serine protease n=1 Tax=Paenibacillus sp. 481 TaxID=2835869 RepID=UPI001E2D8673|nr:trypsin-like peptidase domain-containing protein [Paenibacillus sp. 481]UHA75400.1 trypsin-like peptidase domain-containing protein [Paenibacillus sp. 481]
MSLFDDDFFSPKVSRGAKRNWVGQIKHRRPLSWRRLSLRRDQRRGWSTVQVAVVSSVISAMLAVFVYSWLVESHSVSDPVQVISSETGGAGVMDPYERIVQVADKVGPAVVSIVNQQTDLFAEDDGTDTNTGADGADSGKSNGADGSGAADESESESDEAIKDANLGSGVIFKLEDGKAFVLTNNHVIEAADKLEVMLPNGQRKNAEVVGKDRVADIAVLRMDGAGVTAIAEIGDSRKLRRGETVIAIGNPLGFGDSLTAGIISYTNRVIPVSLNQDGIFDWEQVVIQTDAAINEGNSGGALVDLNGRVIGINTMKIATTGVEGMGFAIPTHEVMTIVDQLLRDGKVVRPYLGVYTVDLNNPYAPITKEQRKELKLPNEVKDGVIVLEASGPAKKAGLKLDDVIVRFDKANIYTTLELRKYLYEQKKVGDVMEIGFYRDGKLMVTSVTLGDKPSE